jgi:hypothetical protein
MERVVEALAAMQQIKQSCAERKKGDRPPAEARASTTDPQTPVIQDAQRSQRGGADNGLSEAMLPKVERRTGVKIRTHVTDAGYLNKDTVERDATAGIVRIMPLPTNPGGEPAIACQPSDGPGVRAWRARMQTEEAKALMRERSGVAETPNTELKT